MPVEITQEKDLTPRSLAFLSKFAKTIKADYDFLIKIILKNHNKYQFLEIFEKGEIVRLDISSIVFDCEREQKGHKYYGEDGEELKIRTPFFDEVDISDLTKLRHLEFSGESIFDEINVRLDYYSFSAFKELEYLKLYYLYIGEIDVSGCENLKYLNFRESSIKNFDCSQNLNLEFLSQTGSAISTLNLRNNKKLKHLSSFENPLNQILFPEKNLIKILYLSDIQFEVKINMFPNLEKFYCFEPKNSFFDFSENKYLKELEIVSIKNTKTIDVFNNDKLEEISITLCYENKIPVEVICNEKQAFLTKDLNKYNKIKPNDEQKKYLKTFKLHQKAINHNPDGGFGALERILKNKYCDIATAIFIYWASVPEYYLNFLNVSFEKIENRRNSVFVDKNLILIKLEKQIMEGKFTINLIPFDPTGLIEMTNYSADVKTVRTVPEELKKPVLGRVVEGFDENKKMVLRVK